MNTLRQNQKLNDQLLFRIPCQWEACELCMGCQDIWAMLCSKPLCGSLMRGSFSWPYQVLGGGSPLFRHQKGRRKSKKCCIFDVSSFSILEHIRVPEQKTKWKTM